MTSGAGLILTSVSTSEGRQKAQMAGTCIFFCSFQVVSPCRTSTICFSCGSGLLTSGAVPEVVMSVLPASDQSFDERRYQSVT